jgi:hypothetical protein
MTQNVDSGGHPRTIFEYLMGDWPITPTQRDEWLERMGHAGFNTKRITAQMQAAMFGAKIAFDIVTSLDVPRADG